MRYRRDISREVSATETIRHVRMHLTGATDPNDDSSSHRADVTVEVVDHLDGDESLVSVVGYTADEIDAPYLKSGFDPDSDHPEIVFTPYGEPELGRFADSEALRRFLHGESW